MPKNLKIIVITFGILSILSCLLVFLPALTNSGLIGTYIPEVTQNDNNYSEFQLKANNIGQIQYNNGQDSESIKWYAKCDGERTSIYFVFLDTHEKQLNLVGDKLLKDISNGSLYKKK